MNLARLLRPELILLEMRTCDLPAEERSEIPPERYVLSQKEKVLDELVDLLERSGRVGNRNKLLTDLLNREKKAGTGLRSGNEDAPLAHRPGRDASRHSLVRR